MILFFINNIFTAFNIIYYYYYYNRKMEKKPHMIDYVHEKDNKIHILCT